MWLNMVNVKPPHLADLEVESMKKFNLDYKRYSQKYPRKLLRKMLQFILEVQLEVSCDNDGREYEEIIELEKEELIRVMLRLHQKVNAVGFGTYEVLRTEKPSNRSFRTISSVIHVRINGYNDFS